MLVLLGVLLGFLIGVCTGWFSRQLFTLLQSIRYQIILFIRKPLSMIDNDPLADIRIKSVVTPKPPTEFNDKNDPYNG